VIHPNKASYSETFIRNHIEHLPGEIYKLYGEWYPTRRWDDSRFLPIPVLLAEKIKHKLPSTVRAIHEGTKDRILAWYLRSHSIQAVLAEYGPTGVSVMNACRLANVPFVVHFHGFDAHEKATIATFGTRYLEMFERASAIVAVSRHMQNVLIELGAPPGKVHYSPYGVDCSVFSGSQVAASAPVFVAVGRFVDKKAPHLTLLAFHRVTLRVPEARLIMIGDGELFEASKQLVRALHLSNHVDFLGPCPSDQVAAVMRSSRAFVQHSVEATYGDTEGTPVAILEAGAVGLPVVSTKHAGIKDVVVDGETGFLVDEGDIDAMADRLIRLAMDPALAASLGDRARQRIITHFSLSDSIQRLACLLDNAISRSDAH
jgi:glycosyltransferase involved in cell wall biosynthesis